MNDSNPYQYRDSSRPGRYCRLAGTHASTHRLAASGHIREVEFITVRVGSYDVAGSDTTTVFVVDDEPDVADVYALRLSGAYETRTAYGGAEALEELDADVDVILLDRRMPEIDGDEVLEHIREDGYDCRVIMLTAVDPGLDIVEMDFDDYLCKPAEKPDLVAAIEQQLRIRRYDDRLSEYFETTSKLTLLEQELPPTAVKENEEVEALRQRIEELKSDLDETLAEFDDIDTAFQRISRYQQ